MKQPSTDARPERRTGALPRDRFVELIGTDVVRFQEESTALMRLRRRFSPWIAVTWRA